MRSSSRRGTLFSKRGPAPVRIKSSDPIPPSEITDLRLFLRRRDFLREAAATSFALSAGSLLLPACSEGSSPADPRSESPGPPPAPPAARHPYSTDEELTSREDATRYNNFYEFGTGKSDPARNSREFETRPWSVAIEGEVARPGVIDLDDLLRPHAQEERIYRMRCVEAWSMVIPWLGIPLVEILKRFEPTSRARYVAFETLYDPERMPGQKRAVLDWPYREGLRIDEATHPLTILAVGMYGEVLPNQNGAPLRLVVPWKYGFKGIKSIVKIRLEERQPATSWNQSAPHEYGFFANVNPAVSHPRWSQARERRIGEFRKRETLPFNGYAEQVAHLYRGMDLEKYF